MQKLLRCAFLLMIVFSGGKKALAQCNPIIYGEDTICTGSSSYLYVDDIYSSYSWSNGSTVSYTYATGAGTITLNTIDGAACHGTASITIRVVQPPAMNFTTSVGGYILSLSNTSTNAYSYEWFFGDGTTSTSVSPTHLYSVKGNYTVCVNDADNFCPAQSMCKSVTIGTGLGMPTDSTFFKVYNLDLFNLNKVVQNPIDSGYLIAGQYDNCGECSSPMFIKTNKNGQVQWSRNFDYLYDVNNLEYFDSGYVFLSQNTEYALTKIDLNGNIVWQKYDGVFGDKLLFPFSNSRVGLLINKDPMEVIIYDENGNVVTQKSYDLGGWDMRFASFAKTSDGSVLLNGQYGYNFPSPIQQQGNHILYDSYDQVAAKMDVSGNFLWMNGIYQNTQVSQNGDPLQNSAGEYLFPGRFYEPTTSQYYQFITRFDGSGNYIDAYQFDSLKGDYSMFLSAANNVVVVSRPQDPVYDSLRIVTMDNSFNILSSKKVTAYNCSKSTKTYDGYVATAFTYFDNNTFNEFPSLYKTNITANTLCLDGTIPPVSYATFPYVYTVSVSSVTPAYTASSVSTGCMAKNYDDSSVCRTCNVTATISITAGDTLLCTGETVTLSAPASMYEYVWSNGAHTRAITVSAGGTYSVTVYDYRGCSASASKHITSGVQYNILFAVNSPNGLCEGSSYSIHAYDSTFQSIYVSTWNTGASGPFVYPTTSGTFTVTFSDQYGCPTSDSITVQLQPNPPVPTITGNQNVCGSDSVQLCASFTDNGSGPYTYSWNAGALTGLCIYSTGGTYSLTMINRFGCDTTSASAFTVTNHPLPNPNLQPPDSAFICPGASTTLTTTAGFASYHWSTNASTSSITVNTAGIYSVSVTDGFGCVGTDNATVYSGIAYNPVFSLDTTNGFCEGTPFILSVNDSLSQPISSYSWSTGGTNSSITVSTSNTYSITLRDAHNCTSTEAINLQMHPVAPSINISGSVNVCGGATTTLCASFTSNNSGPYSYSWNGGTYTDSCITIGAGNYTLVLSNSSGCSSTSAAHTVTNHSLPVPNIQPAGTVLVCNGTDTLLCANAGFTTYAWSSGGTTNCITVPAGNYSVTVTDAFGCVGTDAVTVTNRTVPVPNIQPSGNILVCIGTDTLLCANAGFATYTWSSGGTTNCITAPAGNYSVTVTDANGCAGTDAVTVTDYQPSQPVIMSDVAPFDTLYSNSATGNQWYEVGVGIIPGATQNYFVPSHNGLYYVVVTDANGCSSINSDTTNFIYAAIKTDFTSGAIKVFPNPAHDDLTISLSENFISDGEVSIILYDVIGRKVFETSSHAIPEIHISIATLAPAVYMLELTSNSGKFISRIEKW